MSKELDLYTTLVEKKSSLSLFFTSRDRQEAKKTETISKCRHITLERSVLKNVSFEEIATRSLMTLRFQPTNEVCSS